MIFSAMFDTPQALAQFAHAPHLAEIVDLGEWLGSYCARFTLDGMTAAEAVDRVRQFGGTCILPDELIEAM